MPPQKDLEMPSTAQSSTVSINNLSLEVERRCAGKPLLLLAGEEQLEREAPFLDALAKQFEVITPSLPGFGVSERPDWIANADDISYILLDLLDELDLTDVTVLGCSFGGWVAAEMAVKNTSRISRLVLVDAYGIKVRGPFDRDIMDIWTSHPTAVAAAKWADVEKGKRDFSQMNDDQLTVVARNIESFARFGWDPYMHNPKLRQRLHRIDVPTLLIWGEKDGIVDTAYGEAYANLIPGAKFATISGAAHYPHLEAPDSFLATLNPFIN
jgi:pimeloyl-ACP methyl ester carboxylesterase